MKKYQKGKPVKRSSKKKKILLFTVAGLIVVLATLLVLEKTHKINLISSKSASETPSAVTPSEDKTINLEPPTEEEKQAGNDQKDQIIQKEEKQAATPPPSPSNKKAVKPLIVSASKIDGQIDVRAFVSGIFEDDGICTARFTKAGSAPVIKTSIGFADYNKTTCHPFIFDQSGLPGSGWSVTISYASTTAEGVSDPIPVTVE